jgi:hypothetical protein
MIKLSIKVVMVGILEASFNRLKKALTVGSAIGSIILFLINLEEGYSKL